MLLSMTHSNSPKAVVAVTAETKLRIGCMWPPAPPIISGLHHSVPSKNPPNTDSEHPSIPSLARLSSVFASASLDYLSSSAHC